jgi:hypothetical protein
MPQNLNNSGFLLFVQKATIYANTALVKNKRMTRLGHPLTTGMSSVETGNEFQGFSSKHPRLPFEYKNYQAIHLINDSDYDKTYKEMFQV